MKFSGKLKRSALGALLVASLQLSAAPVRSETSETASAATRRAWEWTTQERVAARRDPALRRGRVAAASELQRQMGARSLGAVNDFVDGKRNPELFLSTELFEELVRSWIGMPDVWQAIMRQRATDLFREQSEWDQFAAIAGDYAALLRQEKTAAQAMDSRSMAEIHAAKCATAARALREARRAFGRDRFDRMLYESVAPFLTVISGASADGRDWSIEREEACQ